MCAKAIHAVLKTGSVWNTMRRPRHRAGHLSAWNFNAGISYLCAAAPRNGRRSKST